MMMRTSWKTVRVFISSTFRDMLAERDYLVRFVFPRLRAQLLSRHIHFVDIDLRWGVNRQEDVSDVCCEIIDFCRPRFLCILGERYGSVLPGKVRSITDEEIHYGVLDRTQADRIIAFFYFRDEAVTATMEERIPGENREPPGSDHQNRLAELKQAIIHAGLKPVKYSAQWDTHTRRLTGFHEFGNRVYDDLLASITSDPELQVRFTTDATALPDEYAEENDAMDVFVEEHHEGFVLGSRESILNDLITHATARGGDGIICLTGAPGSGKSALLAYLSQHPALRSQPSLLLISHFVGASPGSTDLHPTLRRLCHELKVSSPKITAEIPDDPEKLRIVFPNFLQQACANQQVVILLDAINQFDLSAHGGLDWLPDDLPPNARVILSALEGPVLEELRHRSHKPVEIELKPLTPADGMVIISRFSARYRKQFEPDQLTALLGKTDAGAPLYLLAALEELRTLGTYEEISQRITELPPTTFELFGWILKRLENDDIFRDAAGGRIGSRLVPRFATLLSASRHGLSEHELADLLDPGDPQGNLAALLYLLRPYLMRRGELLDFYHSQFRAAAQGMWLKTGLEIQAAHKQLVDYFQSRWREPYSRALSELPYHLAAGGFDGELIQLSSNVEFIEACVAHHGYRFLLQSLDQSRAVIQPGSEILPQLSQELEVLQSEGGSFVDWSMKRPFPDFYNQLANAGSRRGYSGFFQRRIADGRQGIPGCLFLKWSLGSNDLDVKEQLLVSGNRDSYSWDIYDYGPLGCSTHLWIDLLRHRLLTDTVSVYGSMDAGKYQYTHEPMEWDLESGALLVKHDAEMSGWHEDKAGPEASPQVFEGLSGLANLRKGKALPLSLFSGSSQAEGEELVAVKVVGRSVNSEDMVFSVTIRKPSWTYGRHEVISLWVHDPGTQLTYCTSHHATEMEVRAIVRLESGLTAFATDSDRHVYRLLLHPKETVTDESPVLDAALPEIPGEFACIRPDGVEIRDLKLNQILRAYRGDELQGGHSEPGPAAAPPGTVEPGPDLRSTPDGKWIVQVKNDAWLYPRVFPRQGAAPWRQGVYSLENGELVQRQWAEVPPPACFRDNWHNEKQEEFTTRLGKYRLLKLRCSIDVWEIQSGRWVGSLGPGPTYGGGGNLYGIAAHPNERYVISSDTDNGALVVWDLEKNLESWRLHGLPPIGKIRSLAFLWGGYLVAALTEEHSLYLLRFWWQSEIVAAIRVDQKAQRLIGSPYGDRILVLFKGGRLDCYQYIPRPGNHVTTIKGSKLQVRFHSPGSKTVHIAGTFNGWNPSTTLLRTQDGENWEVTLQLPDGRVESKLLIDGDRWELDPIVPFVPAAYGPNNYVDLPA